KLHQVTRTTESVNNAIVSAAKADTYNIHETVSFERRIKLSFASDRRYSNALPVRAYSTDHAVEEPATMAAGQGAKSERIEKRNRACPQGENVADDTSHTGGRTTEWVDRARMIM